MASVAIGHYRPVPDAPDHSDVSEQLAWLEERERTLAAKRRKLHDRIDALRGGAGDPNLSPAALARLVEEEEKVLAERIAVHAQIDELRVAAGLPPYRRLTLQERQDRNIRG